MRVACWMTKATDPYSGYILLKPNAFSRRPWLSERTLMLHYTYIISLVTFQHTDKNLISSSFEEEICDEQKLVLHGRKKYEEARANLHKTPT